MPKQLLEEAKGTNLSYPGHPGAGKAGNSMLTADYTENSLRETVQALDHWQPSHGFRSQTSREIIPRKATPTYTSPWE